MTSDVRLELLNQLIQIFLKLRNDYDTGLMGAIGELYAEVELGMQKAPRGTPGYDGLIGDRRVTVKSKEKVDKPTVAYAYIRNNAIGLADDLLLVQMDEHGTLIHYLAPLDRLVGRRVKGGVRYYLSEIIALNKRL